MYPLINTYNYAFSQENPSNPIVRQPLQKDIECTLSVVRFFSYTWIVLGLLSIAIQIAALVVSDGQSIDNIGYGIWAAYFPLTGGTLGVIGVAKRNRALLLGVVVTTSLSIVFVSLIAAILASIGASLYNFFCDHSCSYSHYYGLEWTLFAIIILSLLISTVLLIFSNKALRNGRSYFWIYSLQTFQQYFVWALNNQSIDFQPRATQLLQQPTHQIYFLGQPIQYTNNLYPNTVLQGGDIDLPPPYQYSNEAFIPN